MKMKIFFLLGLLLFSFGTFSFVSAQEEAYAGLVPCGRNYADIDVGAAGSAVGNPCTLCHLFSGIKNIIDWGLRILAFLALVCLAIAGVMYVVSAGDESMISNAKTFIKNVLIGVVIVLLAWFIVSVIIMYLAKEDIHSVWSGIACDDVSRSTNNTGDSFSVTTETKPLDSLAYGEDITFTCPTNMGVSSVGYSISENISINNRTGSFFGDDVLVDVSIVGKGFSLSNGDCGALDSPVELDGGKSCSSPLVFTPTECGSHSGEVTIGYTKKVSDDSISRSIKTCAVIAEGKNCDPPSQEIGFEGNPTVSLSKGNFTELVVKRSDVNGSLGMIFRLTEIGDAERGVDYIVSLPYNINFPDGDDVTKIRIEVPISATLVGGEAISIALVNDPSYTLTSPRVTVLLVN